MADERSRVWTFIMYPDSAPKDWQDRLSSFHCQAVVSPLHDADLNGDGSEKKPHWHVFISFEGKKSYDQIYVLSRIFNATIPKRVDSPQGLIRYFIHLDNPEKHQYSKEDLLLFGGIDVDKYFKPTASHVSEVITEMIQFIYDNDLTEWAELQRYALDNKEWSYVLNMYHCNSIFRLLSSRRGMKKEAAEYNAAFNQALKDQPEDKTEWRI